MGMEQQITMEIMKPQTFVVSVPTVCRCLSIPVKMTCYNPLNERFWVSCAAHGPKKKPVTQESRCLALRCPSLAWASGLSSLVAPGPRVPWLATPCNSPPSACSSFFCRWSFSSTSSDPVKVAVCTGSELAPFSRHAFPAQPNPHAYPDVRHPNTAAHLPRLLSLVTVYFSLYQEEGKYCKSVTTSCFLHV